MLDIKTKVIHDPLTIFEEIGKSSGTRKIRIFKNFTFAVNFQINYLSVFKFKNVLLASLSSLCMTGTVSTVSTYSICKNEISCSLEGFT